MNDAPMKQQDARTETPSAELSEPHFDEIAVLIAQPVEPIAQRERDCFAWLEKPRMMRAILVVAGLLGTAALALTLQLHTPTHVDTAVTEIPTEQTTPETESQGAADTEEQNVHLRRARTSKPVPRVDDDDARPKARRVGVIYYGSARRP
jgi:hypothetical protein